MEGCFPWSADTANRMMNVSKSFQITHGASFEKQPFIFLHHNPPQNQPEKRRLRGVRPERRWDKFCPTTHCVVQNLDLVPIWDQPTICWCRLTWKSMNSLAGTTVGLLTICWCKICTSDTMCPNQHCTPSIPHFLKNTLCTN